LRTDLASLAYQIHIVDFNKALVFEDVSVHTSIIMLMKEISDNKGDMWYLVSQSSEEAPQTLKRNDWEKTPLVSYGSKA
jgi:hypothetical protein